MVFGPLSAYLPKNHCHTITTGRPRPVQVAGLILSVPHWLPDRAVTAFSIQAVVPADDDQGRCLPGPGCVLVKTAAGSVGP